ncbi:MAG: carbohydrate kinase family protein [Spirochaetales bacterium]|nr:carbohydrate kinase family protein [Spirochaetales bacterium]
MEVSIGGTGCSLMDYLFTAIDFESGAFTRYRSRNPGDGGLVPGALVFTEGLESFTGRSYKEVLREITDAAEPASRNLGGPSIVALVHAAQLLNGAGVPVSFHGVRGEDAVGDELAGIVSRTPLHWDHYVQRPGETPFTHALSDPSYGDGAGERSFVNSVGVAKEFRVEDLHASLFENAILAFGGTALVPTLHRELHRAVSRARKGGSLTVVNTVYDFLNESRFPDRLWPLGDSEQTYRDTDLLVVDAEEAQRLSGATDPVRAAARFTEAGVKAVVITSGAGDVFAASGGGRFAPLEARFFPVSDRIRAELRNGRGEGGDTTGCGDNFVGGLLFALAEQLRSGERRCDLFHAMSWAVASGGYCCFSLGGTLLESRRGEKRAAIGEYVRDYRRQLGAATGDA